MFFQAACRPSIQLPTGPQPAVGSCPGARPLPAMGSRMRGRCYKILVLVPPLVPVTAYVLAPLGGTPSLWS